MILRLRFLNLIFDFVILTGAFVLAYFIRVGFIFSTDLPFQAYFMTSLISSLTWIGALMLFRGYQVSERFQSWHHVIKLFIAGITGTSVFGLIFYFTQKAFFSRLLLIYIMGLGIVTQITFHISMRILEKNLIRQGYGNIRLLIIGSNRGVKSYIQDLQKRVSPYIPIAILDGYGTKQKDIAGIPVLGKLNLLEKTINEQKIDAIIQGDNVEQVVNIVQFCEKNNLDYYLLPYLLGMFQNNLRIAYLERPLIAPDYKCKRSFFEKVIG